MSHWLIVVIVAALALLAVTYRAGEWLSRRVSASYSERRRLRKRVDIRSSRADSPGR